ncbi:hypothetical protein RJ55_04059 [Drechmeria coniospora]|nr:hypothetical protein RJ55_04059 [Drechmeria coniospora]
MSSESSPTQKAKESKPSLYQRYQEWKRGKQVPEEDLKKYLGVTRDGLKSWADTQPGVGKNQLAGGIAQGSASGLGGMATGAGFGGWGPSATPNDKNRGMKFPPTQPLKEST